MKLHFSISGPLDDMGYFEAVVNGKAGLVPSAYLGRPALNGHTHPSPRDRRWQQYQRPPNHLNTTPENIVQMYGQLVKEGKPGPSPKFNGYSKSPDSNKQGELMEINKDFCSNHHIFDTIIYTQYKDILILRMFYKNCLYCIVYW